MFDEDGNAVIEAIKTVEETTEDGLSAQSLELGTHFAIQNEVVKFIYPSKS